MEATRAAEFKAAGDRIMGKWTPFGLGESAKFHEAADEYGKAANAFKLGKQWPEAVEMYVKVAELQQRLGSNHDMCNALVEAANCQKKYAPAEAVAMLRRVTEAYMANGRLNMAARYQKEIAEILESDNAIDAAIEAYRAAADLYTAEGNHKQTSNQLMGKVATLASQRGDYATGAEVFENLGRDCLEVRTLTYNAKGYFLQALLCHLALGDVVAAKNKFDTFKGIDFSLDRTREAEFMQSLITAYENMNTEEFSQACADYDRISPLDPWKTSVLLAVKRRIASEAGDEEVDLS
jgi:alpha-soluble NSF attachment protein